MADQYRMPFECDHPGCTYHASSKVQLVAHKRSHPGASPRGKRLHNARTRKANVGSYANSLGSVSRLWKLPKNVLDSVGRFLSGKKGTLRSQVNAAGKNVRNVMKNMTVRRKHGGARSTRRKK